MPPGISARALRAGSENTTSRSNRPRKVCVFCRSGCPRRVPGSIPSNPGGCMANGPSLSPTGCFRPSSWLSASVLILAVPMNHICLFPKRSRDYALAHATGLPVTSQGISGIIPLWMLTGLRAIAVIGFLLVSRLKNVSFSKSQEQEQTQEPAATPASTLVIAPELLDELRALLHQTTVSEEQAGTPGTPQLTEVATATDQEQNEPVALFPAVPTISEDERNRVIEAYLQGIPRREICSYLRWGNAKYTTIVKPVLDAYEEQERQMGNIEEQEHQPGNAEERA